MLRQLLMPKPKLMLWLKRMLKQNKRQSVKLRPNERPKLKELQRKRDVLKQNARLKPRGKLTLNESLKLRERRKKTELLKRLVSLQCKTRVQKQKLRLPLRRPK